MTGLSKIIALVESQRTVKLAKSHLDDVNRRINKAFADVHRLAELLNAKYESLEVLQTRSLTNIFKAILGDRESQLEMERQEYLQVVLQYNEAKKTVDLLEYEQKVLIKQIGQDELIDIQLQKAIELHRSDIFKAYPDVAEQVIVIEKKISIHSADIKELNEAIDVANQLIGTLDIIIKNLDRAANWGNWDDMKLSQKLAVKSKNLFVDKALANVYIAQGLFEKFEKELRDIHDHQKIRGSYHFHDFGNFTEVYYNRLIADWVIQERIKNSKLNVEGVHANVNLIRASLEHEIKKSSNQISSYKKAIEDVIRTSISNQ